MTQRNDYTSLDRQVSEWDTKFSRRLENSYQLEDTELITDAADKYTVINKFIGWRSSQLDPPEQYRFSALRKYMLGARRMEDAEDIVLVEDRRDPTGGTTSQRIWDSAGKPGYLEYPIPGERIRLGPLNMVKFVQRLKEKRKDNGAERRAMQVFRYIPSLTPEVTLALASTVSAHSTRAIRDFLNRHLTGRVLFSTSIPLYFELQFHIPFFALRYRSSPTEQVDKRLLRTRPLRASRKLPLSRIATEKDDYYHEAQVSFLVAGVDEWFWTSYCCVDTYFGSEPNNQTYLDGDNPTDPASGGVKYLQYPTWNPREYFLHVLARRMMQVTREWRALVDAFQARMETYQEDMEALEERSLFNFEDDASLTRTKELTLAASSLRRFRDSLSSTTAAWHVFEQRDVKLFESPGSDALRQKWDDFLNDVRGNIAELQSMQVLLTQKLELFNSLRDGFVNASALRESTAATRQGEYIGLLTRMTVFYLPLSLATGIFSVSMIPSTNMTWLYYILLMLFLTGATLFIAAKPKLLGFFVRESKAATIVQDS